MCTTTADAKQGRAVKGLVLLVLVVFGVMVPLAWQPRAQRAPADQPARSPAGRDISWAFPETNGVMPREASETVHRVPGSTRTYTRAQIDDLLNPPDWFPDEHPPAPAIVVKGHGEASACASCHLMSGLGHPESADLTGLPVAYFRRTTEEFRSGVRVERNHMNAIARELSEDEIEQAAEWFAKLKVARWTDVVEASVVPQTWVPRGRMRFAMPGGGTEPLGRRIITLPKDPDGFLTRNPHTGFVAYVPVGSVALGKALAIDGGRGRTVSCAGCHGPALMGTDTVPRLAGLHPVYIVRQLYLFKDGRRGGPGAQPMTKAVEQLDDDDIIELAAYLGSLDPTTANPGTSHAAAPATPASSAAAVGERNTSAGVFTDAQATQGGRLYRDRCASCHGARLEGKEVAPAISGPVFLANWTGLTVDELFERIQTSMPSDNPGTLTRDEVSQLVAFILRTSRFPAGTTALPSDAEALKAITIGSN
jgi:cytochrome c553